VEHPRVPARSLVRSAIPLLIDTVNNKYKIIKNLKYNVRIEKGANK
jgi:hypothetical protein